MNKSALISFLLLALAVFLPTTAFATPYIVNLGPENTVLKVAPLSDGTTAALGYINNGNNREAVVFHISSSGELLSTDALSAGAQQFELTNLSPNGQFISGYSLDTGLGLVWNLDDPSSPTEIPELVGEGSPAWAVSSNGLVVGDTAGTDLAYAWTVTSGTQALPSTNGGEGAFGVSADGAYIVGTSQNENGVYKAVLWHGDEKYFLADEPLKSSFAWDVSSSGDLIGGEVGGQAAVWLDGDLVLLFDGEGERIDGKVLAVSDNGFAVGESSTGGFIWHKDFEHARLFDQWLLEEFGLALPSHALAVSDIFFNGLNLGFAVQGSAYFVSTSIVTQETPEPATGVLALVGLAGLGFKRKRKL